MKHPFWVYFFYYQCSKLHMVKHRESILFQTWDELPMHGEGSSISVYWSSMARDQTANEQTTDPYKDAIRSHNTIE